MENVYKVLKEIEQGKAGLAVYSTEKTKMAGSMNGDMMISLASAAKAATGFAVAGLVEEGRLCWEDTIENISFNPAEDSEELYPHLQGRSSLSLREAVEVMIACHDSYVANSVATHAGGWEIINDRIQKDLPAIHVTENPRDDKNKGRLDEMLELMIRIYYSYKKNPVCWLPIINGLVRQNDRVEGIPFHHLNHMTGGLETALVDVGIIGAFRESPLLFVLAAVDLPDRSSDNHADQKIIEALKLLYKEKEGAYDPTIACLNRETAAGMEKS
ncbi:hypothetical protein D3H55_13975 [Bacillus salacetis]|uniref:Beta-lactamase class A catalytic domain-containing protein n=1 Tax=Bacillus salacetis TaxID=2315464 RepID=A0A3A1QXW2_9BACI|nr:serine hydrolase [Bacillus salacetis]RIW31986.1 hypothetical protein D3H55_13975 [Bacillus salacetis]